MAERTNRYPTPQDLHRLLEKGEAQGCEVLPGSARSYDDGWYRVRGSEGKDGHREIYHVCVKPGHPMHGCDCDGYEGWGRCKHYAMALHFHGWLPELPDDDPEPPARGATPARYESHEAAQAATLQGTTHDRRAAAAADLARRYGMQTGAQLAGAA